MHSYGIRRRRHSKQGMVLPICLVLVALLSGTALYALTAAGMNVRFADARHRALLLETACTDALFSTLGNLQKSQASLPFREANLSDNPGGIQVWTSGREVERSSLPPPFCHSASPLFGRFLALTAQATIAHRTVQVKALACLLPQGEIRLLSWTQTP